MTSKTSPQHAAPWESLTPANMTAEREAANWKRTNGTHIPGNGAHRKESAILGFFRRIAA